uniref:CSON010596 protein n=1 Tax=Culicoides sonorensis TaxID=179676 RepID=A0A336MZR2_CULSO
MSQVEILTVIEKYHKVPPLYSVDDQKECFLDAGEEFQYCIVLTVIKPDNTSTVWNLVQKYSSDTRRNNRHDIILSGLCLKWCMDKIHTTPMNSLKYTLPFEYQHEYIDRAFNNSKADDLTQRIKLQYDRFVNMCVNSRLIEKYGLQGYSRIVYCKEKDMMTHYFPTDNCNDYLLVSLFGVISIIIVIASLYNYLRRDYRNTFEKYLYCFSIRQNWVKLTSINTTELALELGCVQTVRVIFTFLIIYGHVVRDLLRHPTQSPEYFEQKFHSLSGMFLMNGVYIVQMFFIIGGFMWALAFNELVHQFKNITPVVGIVAIVLRYLRLTPVYAVFILLQLSSLFMPSNIFLMKNFLQEQENCRVNGWSNLLYINNYYHPNAICIGHSWYLSADFQNAIIGVIILSFAFKYPKYRLYIFLSSILIATFIPAILTYTNAMDGIHFTPPEVYKYISLSKAWQFYIATHNNAGNYLIGLAAGAYYKELKSITIKGVFKKFQLTIIIILCLIGMIPYCTSIIFYNYNFKKPAVWISIYVFFTKHLLSILVLIGGFIVINDVKENQRGFLFRFFNFPLFQILARLTYSMYLVHKITQSVLIDNLGFTKITNLTILQNSSHMHQKVE